MAFNLKKSQNYYTQPTVDPMNDLNFVAAANKVLARYPEYDNIQEFMANPPMGLENVTTPEEVVNYSFTLDAETMEDASENISKIETQEQELKEMSGKPFNLKKAQEAEVPWDPMGLNDSSEISGDRLEEINNIETKKYETHNDLNEMLRGIANNPNGFYIAWNEILSENPKYPDSAQSALKDYLRNFESKAEEQILDEADIIHKYIYGKENTMKYKAPYKEVSSSVNEISNIIRKIAQETVEQEEKKPFNIKTAQHKTKTDAIMYGPGQTRIDPFYRKPVSDWHIVERNKGFGLVVDDIWNIDYEAIWRGNIMDKYSRPYRDTNTGEWVGGYIQKRFEVDKNIPETSNIQLKPGQKRRPILPQYGNTESRLQEARSNGEIEGASDTSKPFNWKEASKKKS